jgi:hypothetical protein
MMVILRKGVECSAKKAMTPLLGAFAATRLLPDYDLPRRIFLDARAVHIW